MSREALLWKLSKLGIRGNYFKCISHMYRNSSAKLKLIGKISERLEVLIGIEQGHPMSPEQFKGYLLDLSNELNQYEQLQLPELNELPISHLLWADDLVLLALDEESLQKLINRVHAFCEEWGLTVNISKTAVMVFNKTGRLLNSSKTFKFGATLIPSARTYCYLGITFNLCGSFKAAADELRKKGLRAYFALKRMINLKDISMKATFKLFDTLVLPVASYGCQVWLPYSAFFAALNTRNFSTTGFMNKSASDSTERLTLDSSNGP